MSWGLREHLQGMLWTTFVKCAKCRCRLPYLSHLYRDGLFPLIKTRDEDWHVDPLSVSILPWHTSCGVLHSNGNPTIYIRTSYNSSLGSIMFVNVFWQKTLILSSVKILWKREYNLWNIIMIMVFYLNVPLNWFNKWKY